ncbi:MucR family transcriptional regulator [Rhizorhabdus dicambivorans]|uniref:MucR family transcriptional regulator n=1 Tax=Rhizorhabdus dicambivorans TaxID=1850238 RepID=UPI0030B852F2
MAIAVSRPTNSCPARRPPPKKSGAPHQSNCFFANIGRRSAFNCKDPIPMADETVLALTADIVASHVANNNVSVSDLPALIKSVHQALEGLGKPQSAPEPELKPAVAVRSSVKPDYIVSLESGKKMKMLKRYLQTNYGMSPDDYRKKWNLPADYPMVAPNYAEQRKALAVKIGLGRKPAAKAATAAKPAATTKPVTAPKPAAAKPAAAAAKPAPAAKPAAAAKPAPAVKPAAATAKPAAAKTAAAPKPAAAAKPKAAPKPAAAKPAAAAKAPVAAKPAAVAKAPAAAKPAAKAKPASTPKAETKAPGKAAAKAPAKAPAKAASAKPRAKKTPA